MVKRSDLFYWALLVLAFGVYVHNVMHYIDVGIMEDDTMVSMVYARRLVEGYGLTWTDGVRVEGYSNFLWTACQAALYFVGIALFDTRWILGVFGSVLMFFGTIRFARCVAPGYMMPLAFGLIALFLSQPIAIWSVSGLEATFFGGFFSIAASSFVCWLRDQEDYSMLVRAGWWFVPLCLTRPEGPLFVVLTTVVFVLVGHVSKKAMLESYRLWFPAFIAFVLLTCFRYFYFGDIVPNTAHVKASGLSWWRLQMGFSYLGQLDSQWMILLPVLLVIPAFVSRQLNIRLPIGFVGILLLTWVSYVVFIGGDCFSGMRHHVVTVLLIVWLGLFGFFWVVHSWWFARGGISLKTLSISSFFLLIVFFPLEQINGSYMAVSTPYAGQCRWKYYGEELGRSFMMAFGKRGAPYVAGSTVALIPFQLRWPFLCTLGLTDKWLAQHPPEDPVYRGHVGHQLGSGSYVLSKKPDIILFGPWKGSYCGAFQTGQELCEHPDLLREYRFVEFSRPGQVRLRPWVRVESPVVGVIRDQDRIEIPAYVLDIQRFDQGVYYQVDERGIWLPLMEGDVALMTDFFVPEGEWSVSVRIREQIVSSVHVISSLSNSHDQERDLSYILSSFSGEDLVSIVLERR